MYTIKVIGDAKVNCFDENDDEIYFNHVRFDNISDDSQLVEYICREDNLPNLTGGNTRFFAQDNKLFTETTYYSKTKLTDEQLERLKRYTQGQWSDGWGEGYEQYPATQIGGLDVYISPWHRAQKIRIEQDEIN